MADANVKSHMFLWVGSSVTITTCLLPVMTERRTNNTVTYMALTAQEVQWVWIMLFLHNFTNYLERISPVSSVLDNDFMLNNGHIHEGRPQLSSLFCSFCLLSKPCVIAHTGVTWNSTGYLKGKLLPKICLCSTFLEIGRTESCKITSFDKGLGEKNKTWPSGTSQMQPDWTSTAAKPSHY